MLVAWTPLSPSRREQGLRRVARALGWSTAAVLIGAAVRNGSIEAVPALAALLSAMLQATLRTQAASVPAVSDILRNINTLMLRSTEMGQFGTFFLARLDGARLELTFSNAGHNWPVLLRRGGGREFLKLFVIHQTQIDDVALLTHRSSEMSKQIQSSNEMPKSLDPESSSGPGSA